jgi:YD repeat-containing protein
MKCLWTAVIVPFAILSAAQTEAIGAAQKSGPTLSFDRKGRLVKVIAPDGRRCSYHYGPDGRLISPIDPACGEPQEWVNGKRG